MRDRTLHASMPNAGLQLPSLLLRKPFQDRLYDLFRHLWVWCEYWLQHTLLHRDTYAGEVVICFLNVTECMCPWTTRSVYASIDERIIRWHNRVLEAMQSEHVYVGGELVPDDRCVYACKLIVVFAVDPTNEMSAGRARYGYGYTHLVSNGLRATTALRIT